jgi:hypothetical protein
VDHFHPGRKKEKGKMKNSRVSLVCLILTAILLTSTLAFFRVRATSQWIGYVKPGYPDYAPSGMPDFDEKQDAWGPAGVYTWCGPVAVANSLWWLDSEYESNMTTNPVPPPTVSDHFPLVTAYGAWDDHSPSNLDPLVRNLAFLMDTDGQQTHDGHIGTRWQDLENGTKYYLAQQGVSNYLEVHNQTFPDFIWISNETLNCQGVELFLEFYNWTGSGWMPLTSIVSLEAGHFVTCAGVNVTTSQVLISDPYQDAYEAGKAPGRSPVAHLYPHNSTVHNDTQYVSQDAYNVTQFLPPPPPPLGYPAVVWELQGYLQTMGFGPTWHTFIRAAVATSPKAIPEWPGYIKPAYPDYAPSGMPDFDEKQDAWGPLPGTYTWCVPIAVADSLWWLDSKGESAKFANPVPPPTVSDHFPLVTNYSSWDDHDPNNVAGLVLNLARLMDTDGQVSHDGHKGTRWTDMQKGIQQYLAQQGVAGMFEVHNSSFPDFPWIDNETEKCQDVELCLEFWQWNGTSWTNTTITEPSLQFGHCVTCAGANATTSQILISDPYQDAYEAGTTPGRSPVPHIYPHNATIHNDARFVSQDAYVVVPFSPNPPKPPGYPAVVWELQGYLQNMGYPASYHAFIRWAIATSPTHDIAVTNVTSPKNVIFPGFTGNVTATVENHGLSTETFNVTMYANLTATGNTTAFAKFLNVTLDGGKNTTLTSSWNTTGFARGNYTLIAVADPVPGETNTLDNSYIDGHIYIPIVGDLTGGSVNPWDFVPDGVVDGSDLSIVAKCFGSWPAAPPPMIWNANCDVNDDGVVDGSDLAIVAKHFGEGSP